MEVNKADVDFLQDKITAIRFELTPYMQSRNLVFNAEQMLELLVALPVVIGVNLDHQIDFFEERVLDHAAKVASQFYNEQLNEDTHALFKRIAEPDNTMNDSVFVQDFKHEMRFMITSFATYQEHWLKALQYLWELEPLLKKYNPFFKPLRKSFVETMYMILLSNSGDDKIETEQMNKVLAQLGIQVDDAEFEQIKQSVAK
ncbi:hypothetical protein [Raineya orbicola]|jgi:hypothetical protein|uniref:Uncharacterized protein n=1 Tax=Raineya orbicola TaxID=2016530 RepID=A0A2N3III0_9BACT|nr:hypothetical protein [Raineya orbicola]PKQ70139.1 hypothetical protein Rain11_0799 [Raineya orbicola]